MTGRVNSLGHLALGLALTVIWTCLAVVPARAEAPKSHRDQVEMLAQDNGLRVRGLERLRKGPPLTVYDGELSDRIAQLLFDYNYVLQFNDAGDVVGLRITTPKRKISGGQVAKTSVAATIPTRRRGSHHVVVAELTGLNKTTRKVRLMVDTGATTMVLPDTMIEALGFEESELRQGWSQTANGRIRTKMGKIPLVTIGDVKAEDVAVSFIDKKSIGNNSLLGMSLLGRYRFTIDDQRNQLILNAK